MTSFTDLTTGDLWSWLYWNLNPTQSQDPLLHTDHVWYDDPNQPHVPTRYVDANGQTWWATHNTFGQPITLGPPVGSPTGQLHITYDETPNSPNLGYPLSATDGNGDRVTFDAFDPLGDLLQVSTYPVNGNTQIKNSTIFGYDALQRPTFTLYPDNHGFQWFYQGRNLDHVVDEAGAQYNFQYCSPCGALTGITGPLGWSLGWTFDSDMDLVAFRDARNHQTYYDYGLARELKEILYPDFSRIRFSYDDQGSLGAIINGRNQQIWINHDNTGRPTSVTNYGGDPTVGITFSYYEDGALKEMRHNPGLTLDDPPAKTSFTYFPNGLIESVTYDYTNLGISPLRPRPPIIQRLFYSYYNDGLRASMTWSNNGVTVGTWNYSYDPGGRLIGVTTSWGETTGWLYDGEGKLLSQSNANGTSGGYQYNQARGWPTVMTHSRNGIPFTAYSLAYDNGANTIGNLTGVQELDGSTQVFAYDALHRLISEVRQGANPAAHSYGYDLAGNRASVDGTFFAFDSANKLIGGQYDADGNMTSGWAPAGQWNALNQMTYQQPGLVDTLINYQYDGLGRRISSKPRVLFNTKVLYVFDGDLLLGEVSVHAAGQNNNPYPTAAYTWGAAGVVSERLSNDDWSPLSRSLWYHYGPQGEARQLTDSNGLVADSYHYTAYGVPTAAINNNYNPFRFGGQFGYYTDPYGAQDLTLCGLRWYKTSLGRWLSRDPIGYDGGPNLYEYCDGNPMCAIDPSGLDPASPGQRNQLVRAIGIIDWIGGLRREWRGYRSTASYLRRMLREGRLQVDPRLSYDVKGATPLRPFQPLAFTNIYINSQIFFDPSGVARRARKKLQFRSDALIAGVLVHEYKHASCDGWSTKLVFPNLSEQIAWINQTTFLSLYWGQFSIDDWRSDILRDLADWSYENAKAYGWGK